MKTHFTTSLLLGTLLILGANQPTEAALTQPVSPIQQQAQATPAGWSYYPDYVPAPGYYYYEPVVPEYYYYYEPVVPYYYAPEPYFVQPGLSFNITL